MFQLPSDREAATKEPRISSRGGGVRSPDSTRLALHFASEDFNLVVRVSSWFLLSSCHDFRKRMCWVARRALPGFLV